MIGIIDYGMGNIRSVYHAFEMIAAEVTICNNPADLANAERIVLPGVGAFKDCIRNLRAGGFIDALHQAVFVQGKPILGICLGMQAMARRSFEGGEHQGLGWINGDVVHLQPSDVSLRVPHTGWNDIRFNPECPLFEGLPAAPDFYFVHSFYLKCDDDTDIVATCDYGKPLTAAICRGNIFATQFHPEKSQDYGMKLLENFINWKSSC
ncbi:MAG: imidazole glycerol phosphate synthase subunit HisH [Desulfobacteraceae bacterium]|nr:MAG: imidazole glycerol phosphate synthase subunit HisH [Desulfobacteraceae bacterium]